jgi:talin
MQMYSEYLRQVPSFSMTRWKVKVKKPKKRKLQWRYFGVSENLVGLFDIHTREMEFSHKLTHVRRWAAGAESFTLDFGEYEDKYLTMKTDESADMAALLDTICGRGFRRPPRQPLEIEEDHGELAEVEELFVGAVPSIAKVEKIGVGKYQPK